MIKKIFKSAWLLPIVLILLYLFYNDSSKPEATTKADATSIATAPAPAAVATTPETLLSPPSPLTQDDFAYELTCQVMSVTNDVNLVCLTDAQQKVKVTLGKIDLPEEERASSYPSEFKQGEEPQTIAQIAALQALATADSAAGNFSCAGKRYCKQMTSCAEAIFYLKQCGLTRLDGNGDGVPCETLCR